MSDLSELLGQSRSRLYSELVQHHLRKQSTEKLQMAGVGTIALLPDTAQYHVTEFIDAVNERIGYDQRFWRHADILTAFGFIVQEAIKTLDIEQWITAEADAYLLENHELAFNLFQIATLNFAYSASTDKRQRKFMGIRKGLFR